MQFSASKLGILKDCPRCFWLAENERTPRPRGIFPSLPGGIDGILKKYYDKSRPNLPAEIQRKVGNDQKLFPNSEKLNKMRHWRSGLTCMIDGVKIIGAVDDLLIDSANAISPYDYKTKGSEPRDDGSRYYQHQLNIYELLLARNGYKTSGFAYLAYYYPLIGGNAYDHTHDINFGIAVYKIKTSVDDAVTLIRKGKEVLGKPMPEASDGCVHCAYERQKMEYLRGRENKTS